MTIHEANTHLSRLIAEVERGEEVIIVQALNADLKVISSDRRFDDYGVKRLW